MNLFFFSFLVGCHCGAFEGEKNVGFMFLVEVAVGDMHFTKDCDCSLKKAPPGYNSIVGRGRKEPGKL